MPCFAPMRAFRSRIERTSTGERAVTFKVDEAYYDTEFMLPCGKCIGCKKEKSRQWAMRCMHEASLHKYNCFLTLTHNDESLPLYGSLDRDAFPLFMKRLRKRFSSDRIRYFHVGEYGSKSWRPHYHCLLFGFEFPDRYSIGKRGENEVYRSPVLERLWSQDKKSLGLREIGSLTFQSALYCCKYLQKDTRDDALYERHLPTGEVVHLVPEYSTMSRRPGIGRGWIDEFKDEVYQHDSVVVNGHECKPVRYYDDVVGKEDPALMRRIKRKRVAAINPEEQTPDRLTVREGVAVARHRTFAKESI